MHALQILGELCHLGLHRRDIALNQRRLRDEIVGCASFLLAHRERLWIDTATIGHANTFVFDLFVV
jgi:hypothetical protein